MASLVEHANTILKAATSLQQQLDKLGLSQPSLEVGGRPDWHDATEHPELVKTRAALIDASQAILNLALGPTDLMTDLASATTSKLNTVHTLVNLGVAQAVPQGGSISISDLAAQLSVHEDLLHRYLKFAYTMGLFCEPHDGLVAHTASSAALPACAAFLRMHLSPLFMRPMSSIPEALRQSTAQQTPAIPAEVADPQHRTTWQILEQDPSCGLDMERFTAAMKSRLAAVLGTDLKPYVYGFDWASLGERGVVVDVGGGSGHIEVSLIKSIGNVDFIVQDLPTNERPANQMIQQHSAGSRIQFQAHDFFTAQPSDLQPKAYMLSRVLHDWDDDHCVKILKPLMPAMEKFGTKLFISDRVLPDQVGQISNYREQMLRVQDLLMYQMHGGKERSLGDWKRVLGRTDERLRVHAVKGFGEQSSFLEVVLDP